MNIEAFCSSCAWVNKAYSRIQDVPRICPECHKATVHAEVRYRSDFDEVKHPRREGER